MEQMGGEWSLAAYYRSILMCSVLCQFFLRERTRHGYNGVQVGKFSLYRTFTAEFLLTCTDHKQLISRPPSLMHYWMRSWI